MKTDIISFTKEDPVNKALGFMSSTNIFTCPITEDNKLIGVLSYKEAIQKVMEKKNEQT